MGARSAAPAAGAGPAPLWWGIVFAVGAAVAFSSAARAPFVFDDLSSITRNPTIRSLSPSTVLRPPPETSVSGRPVVNLTLAVNYAINGALGVAQHPAPPGPNEPVGYHVGNIVLHLACGLLLFALLRTTFAHVGWSGDTLGPTSTAGITTLLWLVHPLQTSAVDYIIARTELVVSACLLALLLAVTRAWDAEAPRRRNGWYVVGVVIAAIGMLSKEVMAVAPVLVLLYDRAFRSPSWRAIVADRARVTFYASLFATGAIVGATILAGARTASVGFDLGMPWYRYLYSQGWVVPRYLRLLAWPSGLTFDYGNRPIQGLAPIPGLVLIAAGLAATVYAWRHDRWRPLGFLGAWFFVILAPSSSFVPIATEIGAERRIYLAGAAVVLLAVLGIDRTCRRFAIGRRTALAGGGALALLLAGVANARGRVYRDRLTLFSDNIAKTPDNPRAWFGAALATFDEGGTEYDRADSLLRRAIAIDSSDFDAWHYRGVIALARGRPADAVTAFTRAEAVRRGYPDALDGIARAYLQLGRPDSAAVYAERLGAYDVGLLWAVSTAVLNQGRPTLAVPLIERAQAAQPAPLGLALLATAYAESGRGDDAIASARVAVAASDTVADTYAFAAHAVRLAGRLDLARAYLARAVQLDSTSAQVRHEIDEFARAIRK